MKTDFLCLSLSPAFCHKRTKSHLQFLDQYFHFSMAKKLFSTNNSLFALIASCFLQYLKHLKVWVESHRCLLFDYIIHNDRFVILVYYPWIVQLCILIIDSIPFVLRITTWDFYDIMMEICHVPCNIICLCISARYL